MPHYKNPRETRRGDSLTIEVAPGYPIDFAIRELKKAFQKGGLIGELQRHEHFESRSERRRKKAAAVRARLRLV